MRLRWLRISVLAAVRAVLSVERPLSPGGFVLVVLVSQRLTASFVGVRDGCCDCAACLGVAVEERPRNALLTDLNQIGSFSCSVA